MSMVAFRAPAAGAWSTRLAIQLMSVDSLPVLKSLGGMRCVSIQISCRRLDARSIDYRDGRQPWKSFHPGLVFRLGGYAVVGIRQQRGCFGPNLNRGCPWTSSDGRKWQCSPNGNRCWVICMMIWRGSSLIIGCLIRSRNSISSRRQGSGRSARAGSLKPKSWCSCGASA